MRLCELREKQVINVADCKCIGFIEDIEFEPCKGKICAYIIPGPPKFCGIFGHDYEYVIPIEKVVRIGADIVLVDVCIDDIRVKCQ
jgi:YlmC/YmxH family sporulation protein